MSPFWCVMSINIYLFNIWFWWLFCLASKVKFRWIVNMEWTFECDNFGFKQQALLKDEWFFGIIIFLSGTKKDISLSLMIYHKKCIKIQRLTLECNLLFMNYWYLDGKLSQIIIEMLIMVQLDRLMML